MKKRLHGVKRMAAYLLQETAWLVGTPEEPQRGRMIGTMVRYPVNSNPRRLDVQMERIARGIYKRIHNQPRAVTNG